MAAAWRQLMAAMAKAAVGGSALRCFNGAQRRRRHRGNGSQPYQPKPAAWRLAYENRGVA